MIGRRIRLAFLAPDIVEAILEGRQPADLNLTRLKQLGQLPLAWADQRSLLGFSS
jgi:site-specific DNA recombinase